MLKNNFALFRYPCDGDRCCLAEASDGGVELFHDWSGVRRQGGGFLFAPFRITPATPAVLIPCSGKRQMRLADIPRVFSWDGVAEDKTYGTGNSFGEAAYARDFRLFHDAISGGDVKKAVLARSTKVKFSREADPMEMFRRACGMFPDSFVALVSAHPAGLWLLATPEVLLEQVCGQWHTMALAGTMAVDEAAEGGWSQKNIMEQRYVGDFVRGVVGRYAARVSESGVRTVRAGNVAHLRTDFLFSLADGMLPMNLAVELHPTPAVSGLPREAALKLIDESEGLDRRYYSGFCGMAARDDFRLFVTLRCMKISATAAELFAGGGIMPDSTVDDEWTETCRKMGAMRRVLSESEEPASGK